VVSSFRAVFVVLGLITLSYRVIITSIVIPIIAAVAAISFLRMIDGICVSVAGIFGLAVIVTAVSITIAFRINIAAVAADYFAVCCSVVPSRIDN